MPFTVITNVSVLALEIGKQTGILVAASTPPPPPGLKDKWRWLQCTLKNETQFKIQLLDSYFNSGRYWDSPKDVDPFTQMVFSCCNDDGSILTGVAGGTAFRVILNESVHYDFAVGWTNPAAGSLKASIVPGSRGVYGYESANPDGSSFMDDTVYEAKDGDGNPVQFKLHFSGAAGQEAMFVVKEIVLTST
ncbi:hypothetical protein BN946_scf185000.g45 [Trametes cinnabarina]|uniref:Uncharacterized protein n=1 Tax=Pycnoporus cinnabarinus TaxID=5643 RepID=A0A060S3C1_PYCCI|nr:hypothetical protein BN946_scf185000.g45 [Trametes cinnabarina]